MGDSTDIIPTPGKDVTSNQHTFIPNANGKRNPVKSKNVHEVLNSSDLFNLYSMLNGLKKDLLWTGKDDSDDIDEYNMSMENPEVKTENMAIAAAASINSNSNNTTNTSSTKGHVRRPFWSLRGTPLKRMSTA